MTALFVWRLVCVPYVVLTAALLLFGIVVMMMRGDLVMRLGMIATVACALPWAAGNALAVSTMNQQVAERLVRAGDGPIALMGPAMLLVLLGASGRLDAFRPMVMIASLLATLSTILTWSTTWMVSGVQLLPSGIYYAGGGPLLFPHILQILVWPALGVWLARPAVGNGKEPFRMQHVLALICLASVCIADGLLASGIGGYFPVTWIAGLAAVGIGFHQLLRTDMLRARGFDRARSIELGLVAISTVITFGIVTELMRAHTSAIVIAALVSPLPVAAVVLATILGRTKRVAIVDEVPLLARFHEIITTFSSEREIEAAAAEMWRASGRVDDVRLWMIDANLAQGAVATDGHIVPLAIEQLASSLVHDPRVIARTDVSAGSSLEMLVKECGPDVVCPLIAGDRWIGVLGARRLPDQALRGMDREQLRDASVGVATACTYLALKREAEVAADAARELEVAQAVSEQSAERRRAEIAGWEFAASYQSVARVAVNVWAWEALPDGRATLLMADVAGRGVAAALLSSALSGAFSAAVASATRSTTSLDLIMALDDAMAGIAAQGTHTPAFVAVFSSVDGISQIEWTNAAHTGAMIYRMAGIGDPVSNARRLGGESNPLGDTTPAFANGNTTLEPDAVLVTVSRGVVDATDAKQRVWGDARLDRAIRTAGRADAIPGAVRDAVTEFLGGQEPPGDLLIVAARSTIAG